MLERLFTSSTRVRLLEQFFLNPGKWFHLRDLARKIETNPTYAKKELDNLAEFGLVQAERKGNLLLFSARNDNPVFGDLKNIFLKTEGVGWLLKEKLAGYEGVRFALLYGSFAKGNHRQTSDVDVLVIGKLKENHLLAVVKDFEEQTSRELNYVLWTEEEFLKKAREKTPLLTDIVKGKFIMLKGDEDEFRKTAGK